MLVFFGFVWNKPNAFSIPAVESRTRKPGNARANGIEIASLAGLAVVERGNWPGYNFERYTLADEYASNREES